MSLKVYFFYSVNITINIVWNTDCGPGVVLNPKDRVIRIALFMLYLDFIFLEGNIRISDGKCWKVLWKINMKNRYGFGGKEASCFSTFCLSFFICKIDAITPSMKSFVMFQQIIFCVIYTLLSTMEWQLSAASEVLFYSVLLSPFIPHLWCVLFRYREMSQTVLTILHTGLLSGIAGAVRSVFELLSGRRSFYCRGVPPPPSLDPPGRQALFLKHGKPPPHPVPIKLHASLLFIGSR